MFVKEYVKFYNECQKSRCKFVAKEKNVKDKLLLQVENIKRKYESINKIEVRLYIRLFPENMSVEQIEYIKQQIQ